VAPLAAGDLLDRDESGHDQEEPIATEIANYGTKVFSTRTREQFMAYLKEMEAGVPAEHRQLAMDTYGKSWLTGFLSILEWRGKEPRGAFRRTRAPLRVAPDPNPCAPAHSGHTRHSCDLRY
jgi:hypothetical protein